VTRILRPEDPRALDVELCGPDMVVLARLFRAGVPVVASFVVTTESGALEDPEVEAALIRAYDNLSGGRGLEVPVTVRGPQHDGLTLRDVLGAEDLLAAVAACRTRAAASVARPYGPGGAEAEVHPAILVHRADEDALRGTVSSEGKPGVHAGPCALPAAANAPQAPVEAQLSCQVDALEAQVSQVLEGPVEVEWTASGHDVRVVAARPARAGWASPQTGLRDPFRREERGGHGGLPRERVAADPPPG
jgi:hypothetical protein